MNPLKRRINAIVDKHLKQQDGHIVRARRAVLKELHATPRLIDALLTQLVADAVDERVRARHRHANEHITRLQRQASTTAVAAAITAKLLDLVLRDGTRLKAATRPLLYSEASFHAVQARTMTARSNFYTEIALHLPNDHVSVGQQLSEEQVYVIFKKAEAAADALHRSVPPTSRGYGPTGHRHTGVGTATPLA